ncbi:MAG: hypothetical protein WBG32_21545 [Nodosilinea sp.]
MRPQDPNFPSEIPPIPPPRNGGEADAEDNLRSPDRAEAVEEEAEVRNATVAESGDSASRDDSPDSVAIYRFSPDAVPDAAPNFPADAADAAPVQDTDRPAPADTAPWTDSDLQDVEDPLPVPTPELQPTYIDRGRRPDSAAVPYKNTSPIAPAEDVWADTGIPYQPKELGVVDQLLLLLADGVTLWKKGLRWVRSQLPPDLQRQLSDGVLTAIALGLLMLFLALWNPLGKGQSEQVASESSPRTGTEAPVAPAEAYFSEARPSEAFPKASSEALSEPPSEAHRLDSDSNPAPEPAPVVESTPDQNLIADIQTRVSRISRSYGAGLIQSVEVNLPKNTLDVNVAEAWYGLLATQQNEVAQDIFAQAQGLNFGTLQLLDPEGEVVARNPVVGPNMVVLHRLHGP